MHVTADDRHPKARCIRLNVEAGNAKGTSFYRKAGFTIVGEAMQERLTVLQMEKAV